VSNVHQVTHLHEVRHAGGVNFQSMVLSLLRSVMYKHRVTFALAYFFRRLPKELQRAAINVVLSVCLPVHPHETTGPPLGVLVWQWPNITSTLREDSHTFMSVVFAMERMLCVRYNLRPKKELTICK
jgi:hypothetical protein